MFEAKDPSDPAYKAWAHLDDFAVLEFSSGPGDALVARKHKDYSVLRALERRPGLVHFVADSGRPGVGEWMNELELRYFPPGTSRNAEFLTHVVRWEELLWAFVTVPAKCRRFAEKIAALHKLRIADGVPTAIDHTGHRFFPVRGDRVFTLEFTPDFDYAAVNDGARRREMFRAEEAAMNAQLAEWKRSRRTN